MALFKPDLAFLLLVEHLKGDIAIRSTGIVAEGHTIDGHIERGNFNSPPFIASSSYLALRLVFIWSVAVFQGLCEQCKYCI